MLTALNQMLPDLPYRHGEGNSPAHVKSTLIGCSVTVPIIDRRLWFRILSKAFPISPSAFERVQGLRRKVYDSHDYEEAITAFLEKRPPKFKGE